MYVYCFKCIINVGTNETKIYNIGIEFLLEATFIIL